VLEINENSEIDDDPIQQRQHIRYANKTFPWQQEIIICKTFPRQQEIIICKIFPWQQEIINCKIFPWQQEIVICKIFPEMDHHQHHNHQSHPSNKRKGEMSLDLKSNFSKKRLKQQEVLLTPDVLKMKLPTPDIEKFILHPESSLVTPTQVFFPKNVTEEQELYAKGFEDALAQLQQDNSSCSDTSYVSMDNSDSNSMSNNLGHPIDMASQEKIKLERKRQRNRVAASKCRKRKLERIAKLEDKVKLLKEENCNLGDVLNRLKNRVGELKDNIKGHVQLGCNIHIKCEVD
jgi:transcription factor AP-1